MMLPVRLLYKKYERRLKTDRPEIDVSEMNGALNFAQCGSSTKRNR